MLLLDYYREQCRKNAFIEDSDQVIVLQQLQKTYTDLCLEHQKRASVFALLRRPEAVQGLYLWGGVGIGKTFLMDCFYHCVPFPEKTRMHFHQFMQLVHQGLKKYQGKPDPLMLIAREFAQKTMLLCFDELFVTDITDAMILGRLFTALLAEGICLVATSNVPPDDLYKNGLQKQHFIPVITMLKQHMLVVHLASTVDYRLRHLKHAGVFFIPNDETASDNMEKSFSLLAGPKPISNTPIEIHERLIKIRKKAGDIVWLDFTIICAVPRSQQDYLALAEEYSTVFISDVPVISPEEKDKIILFVRLIDVFYDARIRLVLSAETAIEQLYPQGPMLFEYTRASSRLLEMQSEDYFSSH